MTQSFVEVDIGDRKLKSQLVIGAFGVSSKLHSQLNSLKPECIIGLQAEFSMVLSFQWDTAVKNWFNKHQTVQKHTLKHV